MASEKKIDPSLKLISEYLHLADDTIFVIPEYQRAYKWEHDVQCDKLWEDVNAYMQEDGKDPYFFGTVIIDASKDGELRLIDGQQRTTTFVLLMKALLVRIEEVIPQMAEDEESRGIKEDLDKYRRIIIECLYKKDDEDDVREVIRNWASVQNIEYIKNNSINEEPKYKDDITKILQGRTFDDIECNVHRIPRRQKDNKYTNFFRNFKFFYHRISSDLKD
ncbi:MAG: DUF262 domain-containing protein, partial [Bacteroidales bacterium]|nr:DUF262 domain-containing protein [Bacteroidales bacterium]